MDKRFLSALDEYFCANYSDYVRLNALEGYKKPDLIFITKDGNVANRDPSCMRLCHQKNAEELLAAFKAGYADTEYTFNFSFIPFSERIRDVSRKNTFAKLLRPILAKYNETVQSAGKKLDIEPRFWEKIAKGKLYPEKCTVEALALVCGMYSRDAQSLLNVCGFELQKDSVRDVVFTYLLEQRIFNAEMRDACLSEYHITNLPIRAKRAPEAPQEGASAGEEA